MSDRIEINDTYAAGWLLFHGYDPEFLVFGQHLTFCFPATDEVRKLLDAFHREDQPAPARSYANAVRRCKGYLYAFKHGNLDVWP